MYAALVKVRSTHGEIMMRASLVTVQLMLYRDLDLSWLYRYKRSQIIHLGTVYEDDVWKSETHEFT